MQTNSKRGDPVELWKNTLHESVELEKTAVLRKGVELLFQSIRLETKKWTDRDHDRDAPTFLWDSLTPKSKTYRGFYELSTDALRDAGIQIGTELDKVEWRRQNPLVDYFRFLRENSLERSAADVGQRAAKQLCFYDCLQRVDELSGQFIQEGQEKIPYLYERLCNCMRELMIYGDCDTEMCYLVHYQREGFRVLASSSPAERCLGSMLDESDFESIGWKWRKQRESGNRGPGHIVSATLFQTYVCKKEFSDQLWDTGNQPAHAASGGNCADEGKAKKEVDNPRFTALQDKPQVYAHRVFAIRMDLPAKNKERFYLFFQKKAEQPLKPGEAPDESVDIQKAQWICARDILAFRDLLVRLTERNLHVLLLGQSTCRYISSLNDKKWDLSKAEISELGSSTADSETARKWKQLQEITILHLTDLHIKTQDRALLQTLFAAFPSKTPPETGERPVDLLVITGDIVQGQVSAGALEEHYQLATSLLRKLAKQLWGYKFSGGGLSEKAYLRGDWQKRIIVIPGNHDYASMNELEVVAQKGSRNTIAGYPAKKEGGPMVKFAYYIQFLQNLLGLGLEEQIRDWLNAVRYYDELNTTLLCLNTSSGAGPLRNNKMCMDSEFLEQILRYPKQRFQENTTICLAHHLPTYAPNYLEDRYYSPTLGDDTKKICECFRKALVETDAEKAEGMLKLLHDNYLSGFTDDNLYSTDPFLIDFLYYIRNYKNKDDERCHYIKLSAQRDKEMEDQDRKNYLEQFRKLVDNAQIKIALGGHIHRTELKGRCYAGPRGTDKDGMLHYGILRLRETDHDWLEAWTDKTGKTGLKRESDHFLEKIPHADNLVVEQSDNH